MAIDAGTGSVRAVIFDLSGNELGVASREWSHNEIPKYPGSMEFDCKNNFELLISSVKEVIEKTKISSQDIMAVSTTSMREGIVLYNEEGKEIWACSNVDARATREVSELKELEENIECDLYKTSGQTFALGALPRILWVKKNLPDVYNNTSKVTMLNDWIVYKLCDKLVTEPSNSCTTGIFNINKRAWSPQIARRCNLRDDIFPDVLESGSVVGNVSAEICSETGFSPNTLVITGGGDAQLGSVGVGAVEEGDVSLFGGSFWQLEYNTKNPLLHDDCEVRVNCHSVPDMVQYEAIAFFPGLIMRWYRDAFCQGEKEKGETTNIDAYQLMNQKAEKIPAGSHGMLLAFSNVMDYKNWRHASPTFTNFALDSEKYNKYTFYRSIMENAALVTKGHLDLVEKLNGEKVSSIIFANGASKSPLWCQIVADTLNVEVKVPKVKEATALGCAICAGVGAKVYDSFKDGVDKTVKWDKVYTPNEENSKVYNQLYKDWRKMYDAQLDLAVKGITNYMWCAPGL